MVMTPRVISAPFVMMEIFMGFAPFNRSVCWAALSAAAIFVSACGGQETSEAEQTAAPTGDAAPAAEQEAAQPMTAEERAALAEANLVASEKFLEENAKKEGVIITDSGLQYMILEEGPEGGATPEIDDIVDLNFTGAFKDGKEFDTSYARGRGAAARAPLKLIKPNWWTQALQLMSTGDSYRFFVPPGLAFGESGIGPIGPNEALVYDISLVNVLNPQKNLEAAEKFLAENAKKEGILTTDSGLQYEVLVEGPADGPSPNEASKVKVHYKGTLLDGTEFDSSYSRGTPAEFPVGGVIAGWTEALQLMSVGDKFRLFIHPKLGYGETPRPGGAIGPNDALVFEVELLEVN